MWVVIVVYLGEIKTNYGRQVQGMCDLGHLEKSCTGMNEVGVKSIHSRS